ncbi:MAG: Transcriptional regulator [Conexibacter sp.]|nr:Transcriptional regulator [Conexibacter sp.]
MTSTSNGRARGRRKRPRVPTADRLLALAAREFRANGFHATTTRELSAALGIEKSSLYYHVSSKDDLLYRICVESLNRIKFSVEQALADVEDPLERVNAMMTGHIAAMLEDRDLHATMLVELRALGGAQRDEVVAMRDGYETTVRETLAQAQESGALTNGFTAHELTLSLLNLLNWTIFWYRPEGVDSVERIDELFRTVFLQGAGVSARAASPGGSATT